MLNHLRLWIIRNAVDISNGLLVIALFYFLILGITARVYVEYPFIFGTQLNFGLTKIVNLLQVGVWLILISLLFNYLYEFVMWLGRE